LHGTSPWTDTFPSHHVVGLTAYQFTSTSVEPAKGYDTFFGNKKHHMRHQKLASGLALIGATSPDAKTVTACSVEVTYPEGSNDLVVILRIAQNKLVDEEEKSKLWLMNL
jgi:hypothetical protein